MVKLGERKKNLDVVIHDMSSDGGVEEVKEQEPEPEPVIKKEERVEPKRRKLSEKQLESLRIGREKNLARKQERRSDEETEKLRLLIQEEMEKRKERDEKQKVRNAQVDFYVSVLAVCLFLVAFVNIDKRMFCSFTDHGAINPTNSTSPTG